MSTQTIPMDDKELFSSAVSDEPITEAPTETQVEESAPVETAEETAERVRDEKGRFAAKAAEPTEAPRTQEQAPVEQPAQAQAATKEDAQVPSWRLREEREAREAADRRAAERDSELRALQQRIADMERQNQPKPEPVDWYQNPDGALDQRFTPFEARLQEISQSQTVENSELRALIYHGKDTVEEARKALQEGLRVRDPDVLALDALASRSRDPWSVVMKWHQQSKLQKEIGGDLDGYKTRLQEQLLNDPKFLAAAMEKARAQATGTQTGAKQPVVQLPPSLNKTPSAASAVDDDDGSDAGLYAYATK